MHQLQMRLSLGIEHQLTRSISLKRQSAQQLATADPAGVWDVGWSLARQNAKSE